MIRKNEGLVRFNAEINAFSGTRFSTRSFVEKLTNLQKQIIKEFEKDKDLLTQFRLSVDNFKWYKEELLPLRAFFYSRKTDSEFVTAINGNQTYDAKWESTNGEKYVEITSTKDHIDKKLMEHLEKYGWAPLTLESPREIIMDRELSREYLPDATSVPEAIQTEWNLITKRISDKILSGKYQGRFILLVEYSPGLPCRFEEVSRIFAPIKGNTVFEEIFIVEPEKNISLKIPG